MQKLGETREVRSWMKILGPGWPGVERYALQRPAEGAGQGGGGEACLGAHTHAEGSRAVDSPDLPLIF